MFRDDNRLSNSANQNFTINIVNLPTLPKFKTQLKTFPFRLTGLFTNLGRRDGVNFEQYVKHSTLYVSLSHG